MAPDVFSTRLRKVVNTRLQAGDSLVEVVIAMALLSFVLLSSTALTTMAFRTGETATERLQVANVAQEQLEALRNFRDNNTWPVFKTAINAVSGGFHMQLSSSGGMTQWVPVGGDMTTNTGGTTLTVPTSRIKITTTTGIADQECGYDFVITYSFETLGGSVADKATGAVMTRLANLNYHPLAGQGSCP